MRNTWECNLKKELGKGCEVVDFGTGSMWGPVTGFSKHFTETYVSMFRAEFGDSICLRNTGVYRQVRRRQNPMQHHPYIRVNLKSYVFYIIQILLLPSAFFLG
jgi:hypothetical protein